MPRELCSAHPGSPSLRRSRWPSGSAAPPRCSPSSTVSSFTRCPLPTPSGWCCCGAANLTKGSRKFRSPNRTSRILRTRATVFEGIGAWGLGRGTLSGGEPEPVQWAVVSSSLFDVLSVRPALGRGFMATEDAPGAQPVAIISHGLWQRRFGGAPDAIGGVVTLDDRPMQVVGVLPAGFSFLTFPGTTDVWLPLGADPASGRRFARGARSMGVVARLREGTSLASARTQVDTIAAGLATAHPRFNTGRHIIVVPLSEQVTRGVRDGALVRPATND